MKPFHPIFIGGCPRSGTTFLADRLGAILGAKVTPESQFKAEVLKALDLGNGKDAVESLLNHKVYRLWLARPDMQELSQTSDARLFFEKLVFPEAPAGAKIWIDHTPINFELFKALCDIFPTARFVHLVRDGRAVYNSVRKLSWGPNNPIDAAWWWSARVAPGMAASVRYPNRVTTVRYEDLVAGSLEGWRNLARFVGQDPDLRVAEGDLSRVSGFSLPQFTRHQHELVGLAPDSTRLECWKSELPARFVEIFEAHACALLDALGYPKIVTYPRFASRIEKMRMGEWPVRIRAKPWDRIETTVRWLRVKEPA